jgi:hypothetical protein
MFLGLLDPDPDPLVTGTDTDPFSGSFPIVKFVERTEIMPAK